MCPSHPQGPRPYQLEYAPEAWKGLSLLSSEEFNRVQRALQALSEQAPPPPSAGAASRPGVFHLATLRVRYSLEAERNVVTLLEVSRVPAEGEGSP